MPEHQDRPNPEYWHLVAAFEIEGCNVPMPTELRPETEFTRHLANFQQLQQLYPNDDVQSFVECAAPCRLDRNSTGEPSCFSVEGRRRTTSHLAIVRSNEAIRKPAHAILPVK